jgi:hypothetical protein
MGFFGRGGAKKGADEAAAAAAAAPAAPAPPAPLNDAEEAKVAPSVGNNTTTNRPGSTLDRNVSGRRASSLLFPGADPSLLDDEWRAKTDEQLDPSPLQPHRRRILLAACLCILGNELCERLAYYSAQTNMVRGGKRER